MAEEVRELQAESSENPFVEKFEEFFKVPSIKKQVERLIGNYPEKKSLLIDFKELEQFDYQLADELLSNPDNVLQGAQAAVQKIEVPALEIESFNPHVRFFNLPKDSTVLIREVSAKHLNKLISVEGVVRQFNQVQPKLRMAVWKCRRCGNTYKVDQDGFNTKMPSLCECKHRDFELEEAECSFINHQKIGVQEPLEKLKGSEQANTLDAHALDDLVNKVAPGDKTIIAGILRLYPPQKDKHLIYGRYLEALSIQEKEKEFEELEVSKEEEEEIKKLSKRRDIFEKLRNSIAPSIYGHDVVKDAIVLQLFNGVKKTLPGEMKVRGNIHVLLVGDPGTGKSQILRAIDKISPKSVYTSGKTSTSAGLTASAEKDEFGEGGWTLKAGALVLASGGMAMVDEFDKMNTEDRSSMHEAMEQGTVSIAKAGIVTTFRTDTSILAAANPKFSRFDAYLNALEQVDLPPTLVSRFDLLFLIKDTLDRKKDEETANFILRKHQAGEKAIHERTFQKKVDEIVTEKLDEEVIDSELLKKYVSYARQHIFPIMTDEALNRIQEFYLKLRDIGRQDKVYSATHRQLEALVRLSEASARVRLKDFVEEEDTDRATRIFQSSLDELAVDKETGKLDIDLITSGQSSSKTTQIKKIMAIIKDKSSDGKGTASMDEVLKIAVSEGIDEEKALTLIQELKKKGDLYEPSHGLIKTTERKS